MSRYDGPVIDPHHHLWDLSLGKHPWLAADGAPVGDLSGLRRPYLPPDYVADAAGQSIVATVHVEAGWTDADPGGESSWLRSLAPVEGCDVARVRVARVPLDHPDAMERLEQEASDPKLRGIRDILSWHPDPAMSFAARPHRMIDPRWRHGLSALSRFNLSFDLMVYPWQLGEAARLAADFPDTRFILNHGGSPVDRSEEGMALWRKGLAEIARTGNTVLKISDLVAYDPNWSEASIRAVIDHCLDCFGPERAMFASDFPVAGLHGSFAAIYDSFRAASAALSLDEQQSLFFGTANRVYRLGLDIAAFNKEAGHV